MALYFWAKYAKIWTFIAPGSTPRKATWLGLKESFCIVTESVRNITFGAGSEGGVLPKDLADLLLAVRPCFLKDELR